VAVGADCAPAGAQGACRGLLTLKTNILTKRRFVDLSRAQAVRSDLRVIRSRQTFDGPPVDHLVDKAKILGRLGCQERIALHHVLDLLERLTGVLH
jgi:hypothetical protein